MSQYGVSKQVRPKLAVSVALVVCLAGEASTGGARQTSVGTSPESERCRGLKDCGIVDATLVCGPKPTLPYLAEIAHIRGPVRLTAVVGEDGSVQELRFVSGHPFLVRAAMDAAKLFQFKPATAKGVPILSIQMVTVTFDASDDTVTRHLPTRPCNAADLPAKSH